MFDMIIGVFDKDGDEVLDCDEFFEMYRNINILKLEEELLIILEEFELKCR